MVMTLHLQRMQCRPNPHLILYRLDCAARGWAAWTGAATASGTPSATARREGAPPPWTAGGRWRPRRRLPRRPPPPTPTPLSAGWTPSAPATAASPRARRSTPRRSTGELPHPRLTELLNDALLLTVRVRQHFLSVHPHPYQRCPEQVFYPKESFLKLYCPGRNFRHRGDFMQRFNEMYRGASGGGGEMGRGGAVGGREGDVDEDDDGRR